MQVRGPNAYNRLVTIILLAALAVATSAVVIFSDRGFDISDEGFYLLTSQYPDDVRALPTQAQYYTRILYLLGGHDVAGMRIAGLFAILGSAAVFAVGALRLARAVHPAKTDFGSQVSGVGFILLGSLLYYTWVPYTPSYNLVNAVSLYSAAGLVFLSLSRYAVAGGSGRGSEIFLVAAAGAAIGVCFFAKFSTGISAFLASGMLFGIWPGLQGRVRAKAFGSLVGGFVLALFVHFTLFQAAHDWWDVFRNGVELVHKLGAGHGLSSLRRYVVEIMRLSESVVRLFWPAIIAFIVAGIVIRWGAPRGADNRRWSTGAALAATVYLAWRGVASGWMLGGLQTKGYLMHLYSGWIFALGGAAIALGGDASFRKQPLSGSPRLLLLLVSLGALPIIGAVGTGNTLPASTTLIMAPGFALILFLAEYVARGVGQWVRNATLCILGACVASQVVSAQIVGPYRLHAGILEQTEPTAIGAPPSVLHLDAATAAFVASLRHIAENAGFRPGDDVLALVRAPGLVFALGGRSPGIAWYTSGYSGARAHNEFGLSLAPRERISRAFVIETSGGKDGWPELSNFGVDFPTGYRLCGELVWPVTGENVRFWKPGSERCILEKTMIDGH